MATLIGRLLFSAMALLFAAFGVGIIAFGRRMTGPVRAMESTETIPLEDVSPGETVEVHGTARPARGTVETPIHGTEALAAVVQVQRRTGVDHPGWSSVHAESPRVPFLLEDDTGTVRVDPPDDRDPTVEIDWTELDAGEEPPPDVASYLDDVGVTPSVGLDIGPVTTGAHRRYGEGAIEPGDQVRVFGRAVAEGGQRPDDPPVVLTGGGDATFVYSTVDQSELEQGASKLGLLVYAFGTLWILVSLFAGVMPWLFG